MIPAHVMSNNAADAYLVGIPEAEPGDDEMSNATVRDLVRDMAIEVWAQMRGVDVAADQ